MTRTQSGSSGRPVQRAREARPGVWLRLVLAAWSLALLALGVWLATHVSAAPIVLNRYSRGYFAVVACTLALAGLSLLAQTRRLYRHLWRWRHEILLLMVSGPLAIAVLEAALRVFEPFGLSYFREASRHHLDKVPDPILVYKLAPNLRRTYQSVEVTTNELGLRDRGLERKAGELRVLLLGDSVTFGWGVPVEATFAHRLEAILESRLRRPVRTVNAGVSSYNTVQEHAFLDRHGDALGPQIVVLVYVSNDVEPNDPPFDPWSKLSTAGKSPPEVLRLQVQKAWLLRLAVFSLRHAAFRGRQPIDRNDRGFKESMSARWRSTRSLACRDPAGRRPARVPGDRRRHLVGRSRHALTDQLCRRRSSEYPRPRDPRRENG